MDPALNALLKTLLDLPVLDEDQRRSLPKLAVGCADARGLLAELLKREWLTPFQANKLGTGQGRELVVGKYVVLGRLNKGGMGDLLRARNPQLSGRDVVLKIIRPEHLEDPRRREHFIGRLQRETSALAHLHHDNVVDVRDAGVDAGGCPYIIMEHLEGKD